MNSLRFTLAVGKTHNSGKIKLLYPKNPNSEFKIFVEAPMLSIPRIIKAKSLLLDAEMTSFGKMSSLSKKILSEDSNKWVLLFKRKMFLTQITKKRDNGYSDYLAKHCFPVPILYQ